MPGLLDLLRPRNLGAVADPYASMTPDLMRAELSKLMPGKDMSQIPPEQMLYLLKSLRQPTTSTIGVRG